MCAAVRRKCYDDLMKAALQKSYGPPETIVIKDVPIPEVGKSDLLIKVLMSSVNRTDCGFLQAKPFVTRFFSGLIKPKNPILGCEFSGIVEQVGEDCSGFKKGDKVFGFDDARWGGHGEFKVIDHRKSVVKMPESALNKWLQLERVLIMLFHILKP